MPSHRSQGYRPPTRRDHETSADYAARREEQYPEEYRTAYNKAYPEWDSGSGGNPGPLTYHQLPRFPPAVEKDYTEYSRLTEQAKASQKGYNRQLDHARDSFEREFTPSEGRRRYQHDEIRKMKDKERTYYVEERAGLFPDQHRSLVEPALNASTDTRRMADARHEFLETHPYGYRNLKERRTHEDRTVKSYAQTEYFDDRAKLHVRHATDPGNRGRDPYGRPLTQYYYE